MDDLEYPAGPVATATGSLLAWLEQSGLPASVSPPGGDDQQPDGDTDGLLRVWPVGLLPELSARGGVGPGDRWLRVRYLLTVDGAPARVAEVVDRLLTGALDGRSVRVVEEPVAVEVWQAFGVPPRLGLYADVPARVTSARPTKPLIRVRGGVRVDDSPLSALRGQVRGPGGIPIPGMRVVALDTGTTTYTDNRGRFEFTALPADRPTRLLVTGKGIERVTEAVPSAEPVVINCEMEE